MKKKILVVLTGVMLFGVAGCGVAEQIVEDAKEDIEWTEENGALTNGRSSDEQLAETVEDLTGIDISDSLSDNSTTSTTGFGIGETVPMTFTTNSGAVTNMDITITGYRQVNNGTKNVTAIFYTATSKDGAEIEFGNFDFNCYADNTYVESTYWEDYYTSSSGVLMPGTTYDGCYIADVDPYTVNKIELYCGDCAWIIQKEGMQTVETPAFDPMAYMEYSGGYSGDFGSASVSFYSSVEDDYVGNASITFTDGTAYSGDFSYNPDTYTFELVEDDGTTISLHFSIEGDSYYLGVWDITNGASNYLASFMLTERYES